MPINGRSCRASARSIEPPSSASLPKPKSGDVLSECGLRPPTKTRPPPGPHLPRGAAQNLPLAGPLPDRLELILGDQIYIAKDPLPPGLYNRLVRLAAFQNPEFYKAQAMRLPTYDKPRIIACAEDLPTAHRFAAGLPGRGPGAFVGPAHRRGDARRTQCRQAAGREVPGRVAPRAGDRRPRPAWPTTPAFWPPRPPLERPSSPRG